MSRTKINDGLTKYQRYHLKNKEKRTAESREYYYKNRDAILDRKSEYDKQKQIADKHNPLVYLLVNENYVGTTENLKMRLLRHKTDKKRDVSEVIILAEYIDRADALELERALHNQGYKGKHKFNTYK